MDFASLSARTVRRLLFTGDLSTDSDGGVARAGSCRQEWAQRIAQLPWPPRHHAVPPCPQAVGAAHAALILDPRHAALGHGSRAAAGASALRPHTALL